MSKLLFENKWVSLYETEDGYVYSHETRCNGETVAILILDSSRDEDYILGRYEYCPAHKDSFALTSFTGGVENSSPLHTARQEIKEEAGYKAPLSEIIFLGSCRPSKSADTLTHLFAWDAAGQTANEIKGDGSRGEEGAYTEWVTTEKAVFCKDPLMSILLFRFCGIQDLEKRPTNDFS